MMKTAAAILRPTSKSLIAALVLATFAAKPLNAAPAKAIASVALKGVKLVVRYGDDAVRHIDDVTKVSGLALREALGDVGDVRIFANVAKSRFPGEVSEQTIRRLQSIAEDLVDIKGAKDVMRLLLSDSRAQVKGAVGELEVAWVLFRRKNVKLTGMREIAETSLGKTDIDVAFRYGNVPVILEKKNIDGLALTSDLKLKIDKFSELANSRDAVAMISAGEIKPTQAVLDYASAKGVTVTYGGLLDQFRMAEEVLKNASVAAAVP